MPDPDPGHHQPDPQPWRWFGLDARERGLGMERQALHRCTRPKSLFSPPCEKKGYIAVAYPSNTRESPKVLANAKEFQWFPRGFQLPKKFLFIIKRDLVCSRGVPVASRGVPVAPKGVPVASRGVPVVPRGVPVASRGVPVVPRGVPVASRGFPVAPRGG